MMNDLREITAEAKAKGLAVVVWSYPRGAALSKEGETAIDVVAYAAQIAAQLGAHIGLVEYGAYVAIQHFNRGTWRASRGHNGIKQRCIHALDALLGKGG